MMGQSGGRSSRHPNGRGAEQRATRRQRDLVDPPAAGEGIFVEEQTRAALRQAEAERKQRRRDTFKFFALLGGMVLTWTVVSVCIGICLSSLLGLI
jgi:hypothetical protein